MTRRPPSRLAGIAELLRPPNVFTAVADATAGLALVNRGDFTIADPGLWCLPASACLYLAGMALNDYFDREADARERPERPIPSGAVPAGMALAIGVGLLFAGLLFASLAGRGALAVAVALAAAIVLYDAWSKGTVPGFLNMGVCRALNFAMPLGLAGGIFTPSYALGPISLGAYVTVVTFLAREEVGGDLPGRIARGMWMMGAALALTVASIAAIGHTILGWAFGTLVVGRQMQLLAPLGREPSGANIGRAIGGSILLIPVFDGAFVAAAGYSGWAIGVAALALPAIALKRFYSPT